MDEQELLDMLRSSDWMERHEAATDPDATEEVLFAALFDTHPEVRAGAAGHPDATEEVLLTAMEDTDVRVRWAAVWNRAATEAVLLVKG